MRVADAAGEDDAEEQRVEIAFDDASIKPGGSAADNVEAAETIAEHIVAQDGDAGPFGGVGEVDRTLSLAYASGRRAVDRGLRPPDADKTRRTDLVLCAPAGDYEGYM